MAGVGAGAEAAAELSASIMARPLCRRRIRGAPEATYYKPAGVPLRTLRTQELGLDEFEALRLADARGLDQAAAAAQMGISQPTFSRILARARQKVAQALSDGSAIAIGTGGRHA